MKSRVDENGSPGGVSPAGLKERAPGELWTIEPDDSGVEKSRLFGLPGWAPPNGRMSAGGRPVRPRLVVGVRDVAFHQEVLDFLQRDVRVEVVGAAAQPGRLVELLRAGTVDAVVVCAGMARELRHPTTRERAPSRFVVAEEMTVPVLREAVEARAEGVFSWPEEREELADVLALLPSGRSTDPGVRGKVISVQGVRGGAGATFVAANLAAVLADRGDRAVMVDLDLHFAELTLALGVTEEAAGHTIADLLPVMGELSPEHVEAALAQHARGFSVLLAPSDTTVATATPVGLCAATVALLAGTFDVVVLHVPRALDDVARMAANLADEVVVVAAPDLSSLSGAKRMFAALDLPRNTDGCKLLINHRIRADITSGDFERILGIAPAAAIRFDPAVSRAQANGELLPSGSHRAGKDLRRLADLLVGPPKTEAREAR